jgi:hypothetical protein
MTRTVSALTPGITLYQRLTCGFADSPSNDQADANDNRDSASEGDIAPWHSSAAEFDNIDDDIVREYENVNSWEDDFPILSPTAATTHGTTPAPNTKTTPSSAYGPSLQSPWTFSQPDAQYIPNPSPSSMPFLSVFSTSVPTLGSADSTGFTVQPQSWELIENPQPSQPPQPSRQLPVSQQPLGWQMTGGYGGAAQPTPRPAAEDASSEALRFIPVDPLQPQPLTRPQRRGPFQDRDRQEETSRTRGLKACVRCRMQKIRVSGHVAVAVLCSLGSIVLFG